MDLEYIEDRIDVFIENSIKNNRLRRKIDYGKKILAEEREKQKNKRKPKKGVKITKVDVERNKDGKD